MIEAKTKAEVRRAVENYRERGDRIGFVPTMGFLHDGHIALIRRAKELADRVVVSIFVNPIQFSPSEDYGRYPRDISRDRALLIEEDVDLLFNPHQTELYGEGYCTYVEVEELSEVLCGRSRPGHFRGVATVVCKLFNIVKPDVAVFGAKDAQQALLIERMVDDLDFDVEIEVVDTVREHDGLAISSRNQYLSQSERQTASVIPAVLFEAREAVLSGEKLASRIKSRIQERLISAGLRIDYVCVVDSKKMRDLEKIEGNVMIAVAAWVGDTRLIDNVIIEEGEVES